MKGDDYYLYGESDVNDGQISSSTTVREQIAIELMNGFCSSLPWSEIQGITRSSATGQTLVEEYSKAAFIMADALIEQSNESNR